MTVDTGLVIGVGVALIALALAGFTVYRYRGIPLTRDAMLEQRVQDLEATVRVLQAHIRNLESELESYRNPPQPAPAPRRGARPTPRKLSGEQKQALRAALLDAYPTHGDWQALLQDIDHPLDSVALGASLHDVAVKVVERAAAEGWLERLIAEAAQQRPGLKDLNELAHVLLKAMDA